MSVAPDRAGFTAAPGMFDYLCKPQPYDPRYVALAYPGGSLTYAALSSVPLNRLVSVVSGPCRTGAEAVPEADKHGMKGVAYNAGTALRVAALD